MSVRIVFDAAGIPIKGLNRGENFTMELTPTNIPFNELINNLDNGDILYSKTQSAGEYTSVDMAVSTVSSIPDTVYNFSTDNTDLLLDVNGVITRPVDADGFQLRGDLFPTAIVKTNNAGNKGIQFESRYTGTFSVLFEGFKVGTVGKHVQDFIDTLIVGKIARDHTYHSYWLTNNNNVNAPAATRNPDCFTASLDFSFMSAMEDAGAPVTLVSPRHCVHASHVGAAVNDRVVFQRTDSTFQTVTIVSKEELVDPVSDVSVMTFDVDVTGIPICKVLPANFMDYMPSLKNTEEVYRLGMMLTLTRFWHDLEADATNPVKDWMTVGCHNFQLDLAEAMAGYDALVYSIPYNIGDIVPWGRTVVKASGGDSGSPCYIPINGDPVLVYHVYTEAHSPGYYSFIDEINASMNTQSGVAQGTYALEIADLTEFNTYPA